MHIASKHFELVLISFAALFLELAVIRWLSSEIRIFAYFKNLPLMAAFLGFGIGFFCYRNADKLFYRWFPRLLAILVSVIALAPVLGITRVIFLDPRQYFLLGVGFGDHAEVSMPSLFDASKAYFVITLVFVLVVATFTALTSKLGELMNRETPLVGYSVNVLGSLLGILGFSFASYLESPPLLWLGVVYALFIYLLSREHKQLKLALIYFVASAAIAMRMSLAIPAFWSPYYQIAVDMQNKHDHSRIGIMVNYDGFQNPGPLAKPSKKFSGKTQRSLNRHYIIPYELSKRPVDSVLILGGGTGNDAAAALRYGANHVDVIRNRSRGRPTGATTSP